MRAPERVTYDASLPLGAHRSGGIFTPDGTGGGTLRWAKRLEPERCDEDGTPNPEGAFLRPRFEVVEIRKEANRA